MSDQNAQEPTMEEILASIRRIISEDEPGEGGPAAPEAEAEPVAAAPAPVEPEPEPEPEEDVLDLTDPISTPALETHGDLDIYTPEPVAEEPPPVYAPEPAPAPPPVLTSTPDYAPSSFEGGLVSDVTASASASAFAALGSAILMPANGRTLEDVVKELLNPLLKAWLDENLPRIVEAKVQEEVQRIARGR